MNKNFDIAKLVIVGGLAVVSLVGCGGAFSTPASSSGASSASAVQTLNYVVPALHVASASTPHINNMLALAVHSASQSSQSQPGLFGAPAAATASPTPSPLPDLSQIQAQIIASIDANASQIKQAAGTNAAEVIQELQASLSQLQSLGSSTSSPQEQQFVQLGIAIVNELIKVLS